MSALTPDLVTDQARSWIGGLLPWIIIVSALLATVLPALRPRGGRAFARSFGAVPALGTIGTVVIAVAVFAYRVDWAIITLFLVAVAMGVAASVRAVRKASLREEVLPAPTDQETLLRKWCTASLLGFLATAVAATATAVLIVLGEHDRRYTLEASVHVVALLGAVVVGDLAANLLLRVRSRTYQAELRPRGVTTVVSRGTVAGVLILTAAVSVGAVAVNIGEQVMAHAAECPPVRYLGLSEIRDVLGIGQLGLVGLVVTALGAIGVLVAAGRPAIGSLSPASDRALRRLSAARTVFAVVGAQIVLAGDLVPGTAYAFLPVDPRCHVDYDFGHLPPNWLPGPYQPGAVLALTGMAVSVAGCAVWAAATWRASTRALVSLAEASPTSSPAASAAGTGGADRDERDPR
ncbi:hypothetical protein DFP74_1300 [Nocardiopsis sp. Huas11]|uniref:hypothetical protein n=1 Tax=Nocardiopsis sp. Huas11 TaxID=2183912 RepID=UPI000EACEBC7|nr:hypothetical protein [Nocardiopsis sp. Huas11]RKS05695.1 hypothetical protein DFP74_1300 [Nocardiopsis sp. Huas11]